MEDVSLQSEEKDVSFKRTSFITRQDSKEDNDFSFMRKKVRVNTVEKAVKIYELD